MGAQAETLIVRAAASDLDEVVAELRTIWTHWSLGCALAVARCVIENVLNEDEGAEVDVGFHKRPSYRALAEHPDLPFSASYLASAVRVHAQVAMLGEPLARKLTMSHHEELLPVKDVTLRKALAKEAVAESYSVRKLKEAVRRELGACRPAMNPYRPSPVEELVENLQAALDAYPGRPGELDPARLADMRDSLDSVARRIRKIAHSLAV